MAFRRRSTSFELQSLIPYERVRVSPWSTIPVTYCTISQSSPASLAAAPVALLVFTGVRIRARGEPMQNSEPSIEMTKGGAASCA
eukprot:scaffold9479_cov109-Isochrysis_galbana.AAC.3